MEKLRKHQFIPFLDVSGTKGDRWSPEWKRIDLSTIFELDPKPQTETMDYISYEMPVEEVDRYQPQLPQEGLAIKTAWRERKAITSSLLSPVTATQSRWR